MYFVSLILQVFLNSLFVDWKKAHQQLNIGQYLEIARSVIGASREKTDMVYTCISSSAASWDLNEANKNVWRFRVCTRIDGNIKSCWIYPSSSWGFTKKWEKINAMVYEQFGVYGTLENIKSELYCDDDISRIHQYYIIQCSDNQTLDCKTFQGTNSY